MPPILPSLQDVHWLGHAGFWITGRRVIFIDPYQVKFPPDVGDVILITNSHPDHCSPDDVKWLRKGETVIVVPQSCSDKFKGDIRVVKPGDVLKIKGITIEVVPAYSMKKPPQPGEVEGVGYVITTVEGMRIYHAGDTGLIPEMENVRADIALLPVGGGDAMDAVEAAQAANKIKPGVAVPMHWGTVVGTRQDAEKFRDLCEVQVEILKAEG